MVSSSSSKRKLPAMFAAERTETNEGGDGGDGGGGGGVNREKGEKRRRTEEEVELQKALELSAAEARVAEMDDEAQMQAAIAQSVLEEEEQKAQQQQQQQQYIEQAPTKGPPPQERRPPLLDDVDRSALLPLTQDAFDDARLTTINRLNGSLDLIVCKAWIKAQHRLALREWMLSNLAWHRVSYVRPSTKVRIVTPRYTATFGKDDTGAPLSAYKFAPKPFPAILDRLRSTLEEKTNARFNAIIINYYADGNDAISYHSDDEAFLGANPTIASISLGASRDFYLRRKAPAAQDVPPPLAHEQMGTKGKGPAGARPTEKMVLEDGDLLVMKGKTQADWEHSVP